METDSVIFYRWIDAIFDWSHGISIHIWGAISQGHLISFFQQQKFQQFPVECDEFTILRLLFG